MFSKFGKKLILDAGEQAVVDQVNDTFGLNIKTKPTLGGSIATMMRKGTQNYFAQRHLKPEDGWNDDDSKTHFNKIMVHNKNHWMKFDVYKPKYTLEIYKPLLAEYLCNKIYKKYLVGFGMVGGSALIMVMRLEIEQVNIWVASLSEEEASAIWAMFIRIENAAVI